MLRILVISILIFSTLSAEREKEKLTIGFLPYLASAHLIASYTPLAQYLSKRLNIEVEIVISKDYGAHLEATGKDRFDISFLGGSPYVVITDEYGKKPLLARYEFSGQPYFRSVVFGRKGHGITSLKELEGKKIAFGNPNSTLSTQVPLWIYLQEGVKLQKEHVDFMSNHENVIFGVISGDYAAGSIAEEIFNENQASGIEVIAYSPLLSTHLFVARGDMESGLVEKIREAFLELKDKRILQAINKKLTAFVKVQDSDYDLHRVILEEVIPEVRALHAD